MSVLKIRVECGTEHLPTCECGDCGWIYEVPGEEDEDYEQAEEEEGLHF